MGHPCSDLSSKFPQVTQLRGSPQKILENPRKSSKILENPRKFSKILENPQNPRKSSKILENTEISQKTLSNLAPKKIIRLHQKSLKFN
jgi:hypothetical protein